MPQEKKRFAKQMRGNLTSAEAFLYDGLLGALSCRVRRQAPMLGYIADFYIATARLVVEVDGQSHKHSTEYDRTRDRAMAKKGILVMRFSNDEVFDHAAEVVTKIKEAVEARRALPKRDWQMTWRDGWIEKKRAARATVKP